MSSFSKPTIMLAAAATFLIVVLWLVPMAGPRIGLCGSCHAVARQSESWRSSAHSSIGCMACHSKPGVGGKLTLLVDIADHIVKTFAGAGQNTAFVNEDNCLSCHDIILDDAVTRNNTRMSHREVIAAHWRCVDCHANTGHRSVAVTARRATPSMDKCMSCHNKTGAAPKTVCSSCHPRVPRNRPTRVAAVGVLAHDGDWKKDHGANVLTSCAACHNKRFCQRCHHVEIPHEKNWGDLHGRRAVGIEQTCLQCHAGKFCDRCHAKVQLPHIKPYRHGPEAKSNGGPERCTTCHQREECTRCHEMHAKHAQVFSRPAGAR